MTTIDLSTNKDPANVLRLAVLDDVTPAAKGTDLIYWRGITDFEPTGKRKTAFLMARWLAEKKRVVLFQTRQGDVFNYVARVM